MDNRKIDANTLVRRNDSKFMSTKLGDEIVMMNMETGDFISMNTVGADIWDLSEHPVFVKDLIQKLVSLYRIDEIQCASETISFLQNSIEQNIFIYNYPDKQ